MKSRERLLLGVFATLFLIIVGGGAFTLSLTGYALDAEAVSGP